MLDARTRCLFRPVSQLQSLKCLYFRGVRREKESSDSLLDQTIGSCGRWHGFDECSK